MVYVEYNEFKTKYIEAQRVCNKILAEKEKLFEMTQPKGQNFENERVNGGAKNSVFDEYLIEKESKQIDERLAEAKNILENRKLLLELKESELRQSKDYHDIIYAYHYIDGLNVFKIAKRIPYHERQIYRILKTIKTNICQ